MERMKKWVQKPCGEDKIGTSECLQKAGATFFEYFLDGSAGVMYTSFLGLIISELVTRFSGDRSGDGDY